MNTIYLRATSIFIIQSVFGSFHLYSQNTPFESTDYEQALQEVYSDVGYGSIYEATDIATFEGLGVVQKLTIQNPGQRIFVNSELIPDKRVVDIAELDLGLTGEFELKIAYVFYDPHNDFNGPVPARCFTMPGQDPTGWMSMDVPFVYEKIATAVARHGAIIAVNGPVFDYKAWSVPGVVSYIKSDSENGTPTVWSRPDISSPRTNGALGFDFTDSSNPRIDWLKLDFTQDFEISSAFDEFASQYPNVISGFQMYDGDDFYDYSEEVPANCEELVGTRGSITRQELLNRDMICDDLHDPGNRDIFSCLHHLSVSDEMFQPTSRVHIGQNGSRLYMVDFNDLRTSNEGVERWYEALGWNTMIRFDGGGMDQLYINGYGLASYAGKLMPYLQSHLLVVPKRHLEEVTYEIFNHGRLRLDNSDYREAAQNFDVMRPEVRDHVRILDLSPSIDFLLDSNDGDGAIFGSFSGSSENDDLILFSLSENVTSGGVDIGPYFGMGSQQFLIGAGNMNPVQRRTHGIGSTPTDFYVIIKSGDTYTRFIINSSMNGKRYLDDELHNFFIVQKDGEISVAIDGEIMSGSIGSDHPMDVFFNFPNKIGENLPRITHSMIGSSLHFERYVTYPGHLEIDNYGFFVGTQAVSDLQSQMGASDIDQLAQDFTSYVGRYRTAPDLEIFSDPSSKAYLMQFEETLGMHAFAKSKPEFYALALNSERVWNSNAEIVAELSPESLRYALTSNSSDLYLSYRDLGGIEARVNLRYLDKSDNLNAQEYSLDLYESSFIMSIPWNELKLEGNSELQLSFSDVNGKDGTAMEGFELEIGALPQPNHVEIIKTGDWFHLDWRDIDCSDCDLAELRYHILLDDQEVETVTQGIQKSSVFGMPKDHLTFTIYVTDSNQKISVPVSKSYHLPDDNTLFKAIGYSALSLTGAGIIYLGYKFLKNTGRIGSSGRVPGNTELARQTRESRPLISEGEPGTDCARGGLHED